MRKKTVKVQDLKNLVNEILEKENPIKVQTGKDRVYTDANGRETIACLMEYILHETGNYQGFVYLKTESDIHGGVYGKDCRIRFI